MNPIEWLATLFWDPNGTRRREQRFRVIRSRRKLRSYDNANRRALEQIRRTHEAIAPLVRDH